MAPGYARASLHATYTPNPSVATVGSIWSEASSEEFAFVSVSSTRPSFPAIPSPHVSPLSGEVV